MKRYTGINHLAMVTNDMDKTIRFWRDLLGMRLVAGLGDSKYRHYFFEISEHDMIAFFEWPNVENVEIKDHGMPVKGPFSFDHVSIGVENDDALWEIRDRIEATGAWVSEAINHGFIHSIYTFDPNNIPIEFSAPVHDADIRKWPKMKDRNPVEAALEGAEPHSGYWPEVGKPTLEKDREIYPGEGIVFANE
jgi:catechol 2,3-dioxygenase-like lactoylglutathione lyase family enzyme